MDSAPGPIGVFDSGLGGLTVFEAAARALPDQDFVYLGDNAHAPYGDRTAEEILDLTVAGVETLFDQGCHLVILACNTAAAVALRRMQEDWLPERAPERRVLGVLVPMIETVTGRPWAAGGRPVDLEDRRIGFFATPATVASGAFPRELGFRARGVETFQEPCPGLVPAIERGASDEARQIVREHCAALLARCPQPDAVILGCTHYPLVRQAFAAALPAGTPILSQPDIVAESLVDYLRRHPALCKGTGARRFLTTGAPAAVSAAAGAFVKTPVVFAQT